MDYYARKPQAGHVAEQKENADDQTLETTKKSLFPKQQVNSNYIPTERTILRSKSANGLKVTSTTQTPFNKLAQHRQEKEQNESLFGNANKARKVMKQFVPLFNDKEMENKNRNTNGNSNDENDQSQTQPKFSLFDTKSLQRSQSHSQAPLQTFKKNTLSRSSSAFDSSFSFSNSLKPKGSIKSQLTLGANNNVAEFFKKSKEEERKQLGIPEPVIQSKDAGTNKDNNSEMNITEVTFEDDVDDITAMKRMSTLRDSPVSHRTHKVSLHSILSSSNDSDDIEETTFEYKEKSKNSTDSKIGDLESLINRPFSSTDKSHDLEIEFVSHNTNGTYDDSIPDIVIEGAHQPLTSDVLANLWDEPTETSFNAAKKFKDPLNLKKQWNSNNNNTDNYKDSKKYNDLFELHPSEIHQPDELQLELSDIEEESESSKGPTRTTSSATINNANTNSANEDREYNTSFDNDLIDLMSLYRH